MYNPRNYPKKELNLSVLKDTSFLKERISQSTNSMPEITSQLAISPQNTFYEIKDRNMHTRKRERDSKQQLKC